MANWQRELDLVDLWEKAEQRKCSAQETAKEISVKLKELEPFGGIFEFLDYEKEELAESFEDFAGDPSVDFKDLDYLLAELYDWADSAMSLGDERGAPKKACWVKTLI